jgi:soluble lytic murein transglycosylase
MPTRIPPDHSNAFKIFSACAMILTVSRCSTISERSEYGIRAPSAIAVLESSGKNPTTVKDPAARAVIAYRAATVALNSNQTLEACEGFRALALDQDSKLPEVIRLLARVRALPVCPAERSLPVTQAPKWLSEEYARARLSMARRDSDPKTLARALRDVAPFEKTQKLKVSRLEEALEIFGKLNGDGKADADLKSDQAFTREMLIDFAPRFARGLKPGDPLMRKLDALAIPNDFRNARQFDLARGLYLEVSQDLERSDIDRLRALDGIRMSYKLQLRTPEFLEATKRWQKFATDYFLVRGNSKKSQALLKVYLDTRIQYARAIWTDHRSGEAKRILLETEKKIASRISIHESALIRARIAEESKDFAESAAILAKVNTDSLPDRPTKARFLWYRGWNLRRLATPASQRESIAILEEAQKYEDRHSDLTRDMYWVARMYKDLGETEKARQLFTDLADFSQFGFYGIVAQRELGLPFPSLKPDTELEYTPLQSSPIADAIRVPADWFAVLGEFEIGRRYVESFPAKDVWDPNWSLDKKEAALVMLSRLEQHATVSARVDELSPDDRKRLLLKRPELLFPLPFQARIVEETNRQSMPSALIYSIMRQESLFNTFARSPADAFGLLQLIPENATIAAKTLGVVYHGPEDLYDPDKNIALGTHFLKGLFRKYDNRFILAVAGYNANDRAIRGWIKTRMRPDPLEFIEEIPYDETRLYVKLVLRNFVTYQRRMSSTPVEFPESLLKLN